MLCLACSNLQPYNSVLPHRKRVIYRVKRAKVISISLRWLSYHKTINNKTGGSIDRQSCLTFNKHSIQNDVLYDLNVPHVTLCMYY